MKIRDIMLKNAYTISPEATLKDAAALFLKRKVTGFTVLNKKKEIVGMLSDKDVYRGLYPSYQDFFTNPELYTDFEKQESRISELAHIPVRKMMSKHVITAHPDEYVMKAGALMLAKNVHRFPVVDDNGSLIGTISRGHIYRALFKKQLDL